MSRLADPIGAQPTGRLGGGVRGADLRLKDRLAAKAGVSRPDAPALKALPKLIQGVEIRSLDAADQQVFILRPQQVRPLVVRSTEHRSSGNVWRPSVCQIPGESPPCGQGVTASSLMPSWKALSSAAAFG